MIRFGPAAAPRWFDCDLGRLPAYLELIAAARASQVEFVLLPGPGSVELGRVHLLQHQWTEAFAIAHASGVHIDLHWPLPAEYRMIHWSLDPVGFLSAVEPLLDAVVAIDAMQGDPPALVLHAAAEDPATTLGFLSIVVDRLQRAGSRVVPAIELRAPSGPDDRRFDRNLDSLISVLQPIGRDRAGVCWDIAHDWEADGQITLVTSEQGDWIRHVHLHDTRPDGHVHGPLGTGSLRWEPALHQLADLGYAGSVTLEIRYRYATEHGEPWAVLDDSLRRVHAVLQGEQPELYANR